jgi:nucleoside-diphosphate-sugar epimerase
MDAVDHVVLGARAVGMAIAEARARRGKSVRVVNRSGLHEPVAGVQSVTGDVADAEFATSATRGAPVGITTANLVLGSPTSSTGIRLSNWPYSVSSPAPGRLFVRPLTSA